MRKYHASFGERDAETRCSQVQKVRCVPTPFSPILSNIYLNELDQAIAMKVAEYNKGKERKRSAEYHRVSVAMSTAKKKARGTGDWARYKALRKRMLSIPSVDHQDPDYRRLVYVRYADDFLVGVIGPKADAIELKTWLEAYLSDELQLELSVDKTLITNGKNRVRFLGYDIARWSGERIYRFQAKSGPVTRRTGCYQLKLYMPRDKTIAFAKEYGDTTIWYGLQRNHMLNLSELEILLTYNAEVRGFLGYYTLADNLKREARKVLWHTNSSFFRTLAAKRKCTLKEVTHSMKRGPGRYALTLQENGQAIKEYELLASSKQLKQGDIKYDQIDLKPNTIKYRSRTELGQRLLAQECEWCGTREGTIEVHHERKLGNLKGKTLWERQMIQRRRKTMVLCAQCHDDLHAGRLSERTRKPRENWRAGYTERYTSGSEGEAVKPVIAI
jgi:hypothetical protein